MRHPLLTIAVALAMVTVTLPALTNAQLPEDPQVPPEGTPAPPGLGVVCNPPVITAELAQALPDCLGLFPATQVTNGKHFTCILTTAGNVHCWGQNNNGQDAGYTGGDAVDIDGGNVHACAALSSGNVECWGRDIGGQTDPYTGGDAVQVSTGSGHTCATLENGNVHCWGLNIGGRADDYTGGDAVEVASGISHNCALTEGGDVTCWGQNSIGQATGYTGGDAVQVTSGWYHSCALLESGDATCWGDDRFGQAADYTGGDAVHIDAGWYHACVVLENGNVESDSCWGNGAHTYDGGDAVQVSRYSDEGCVLKELGSVQCFGRNNHGTGETNDYAPLIPSLPGAPANSHCQAPAPGLLACDSNGDGVPNQVFYGDDDRSLAAGTNPLAGNIFNAEYVEEGLLSAELSAAQFYVFIVSVTDARGQVETDEESPVGHNRVFANAACIGIGGPVCVATVHDVQVETGEQSPLGENAVHTRTITCHPIQVPGFFGVYCGYIVNRGDSIQSEAVGDQGLSVGLNDAGGLEICATGDHIDEGCQTIGGV